MRDDLMRFAITCLQLAVLVLVSTTAFAEAKLGSDCQFNGISLKGKVQVVESFPDVKVQVVSSFPDLKVKKVQSFADACGEWQMVTSFPDFKIQFVKSFPDVKIQYVDSFPGLP